MGRNDTGSVSVLGLGLVVLAVAVVVVVANASRVFLRDRALASAADGAASAAARAVEPPAARAVGPPRLARISPELARAEVGRYVADAGLAARFGPGFGYEVDVTGEAVTVTLEARVPLAFVGTLGPGGAVPVRAEATARSVLLP